MKSFILLFATSAILIVAGCEKSGDNLTVDSIIDTKWALTEAINNKSGEITEFPEQINKFYMTLKKNGTVELSGLCNFSYASYSLTDIDNLIFFNVGPATKIYCLPDLLMDWESLFTQNLRQSESYKIEQNQLTINTGNDYNLVFDFVEYYDPDKGKILFYSNSDMLNCVYEIEISINEISYSLTAASVYSDTVCKCDYPGNTGILLSLKQGTYSYTASELNCISSNKVNNWSGQANVVRDSCTVVFLDIIK